MDDNQQNIVIVNETSRDHDTANKDILQAQTESNVYFVLLNIEMDSQHALGCR